jgi:prevent-host-death family protein
MNMLLTMKAIIPISDLQRQAAMAVNDVNTTGEPIIITQRGRAAAVLMSAERFTEMEADIQLLDDLELLQMVETGKNAVKANDLVSHSDVKKRLKYKP